MKLFFWLLVFVPFFSSVAETPWSSSQPREVPWKRFSEERRESRISFFQSLNPFTTDNKKEVQFDREPPEYSKDKRSESLADLPWKSYQKEWNLSFDRQFIWPVEGGSITSGFGMRRGRLHEGIDIDGQSGQKVRAIGSGRAVYSGWIKGYGRTVVVYHGSGVSSVYAHHRENLVSVNDIVEKGQAIGTLGASGRTSGSHLHFEMRKDGEAQNPLLYHFRRSFKNKAKKLSDTASNSLF